MTEVIVDGKPVDPNKPGTDGPDKPGTDDPNKPVTDTSGGSDKDPATKPVKDGESTKTGDSQDTIALVSGAGLLAGNVVLLLALNQRRKLRKDS